MPALSSIKPAGAAGTSLVKGALQLGGATLFGQAIALAAWPILTRLYVPADVGVFAVYLALANMLGVIACLRYELAVVLPRTARAAAILVQVAAVASLLVAALVAVAVVLAGDRVAALLGVAGSPTILWLVVAAVAARGAYQALNYWASRRRRTGAIAAARIGQQAIAAAAQIGAALAALGSGVALTLGHLAGLLAAILVFAVAEGRALAAVMRVQRGRSVARAQALARRYRRFPLFDVPAALLNVAALELPVLLIAALYGDAAAGQFGLAVRVTGWPAAMATASLAQLFYPRANEEFLTAGSARSVTLDSLGYLLRAGVPIYVAVAVLAPWAFGPVFGEAWEMAGVMAALLAPLFATMFLIAPISQLFFVRGRQRAFLAYQAAYFAAALLGLGIGALLGDVVVGIVLFSALATLRQLAMLGDMCRREGISGADLWRAGAARAAR